MITQLNPPIPLFVPEWHREALAHAIVDYGPEFHIHWVCILDNGEIWTLANPEVRGQWNKTMGRKPVPELPAYEA